MTKLQMSQTASARVNKLANDADQNWPNLYPSSTSVHSDREFYRAVANARLAAVMDLKRELGL